MRKYDLHVAGVFVRADLDLLLFQMFGNGRCADIVWTSHSFGNEIEPFSLLDAHFNHCIPNYTVPLLVGVDLTNILVAIQGQPREKNGLEVQAPAEGEVVTQKFAREVVASLDADSVCREDIVASYVSLCRGAVWCGD